VTVDDEVAAFLLAMKDHCGYINENYEWFDARYHRGPDKKTWKISE
jgi:hypothetical protein